MEDSVRQGT
jgi:hypothetical protein